MPVSGSVAAYQYEVTTTDPYFWSSVALALQAVFEGTSISKTYASNRSLGGCYLLRM